MRTRTKTAAFALTGAVALASGAYALGTQAGGGAAVAADQSDRNPPVLRAHWRGGPFGSERLADRLGVDESELRDALEDVRPRLAGPPAIHDDFAERLADELGIDRERVEAALERMHDSAERELEQRRDELAQRLADRLDLDVDEVQEALGDSPFFWHGRLGPPPGP
jgi:energy-converting hydrogenase A subunit M